MNRAEFKTAWRFARVNKHRGGQSIGGLYMRPGYGAGRAEIDPRPFYWRVVTQQGASVSDRRFYVKRGRAIRRGGFKTIHPEGLRA